ILPDYALGGNAIKARLAWSAFLFGVPVAAQRLKWLPLNTLVAGLLAASLFSAQANLRGVSRAAEAYSAALSRIPAGAKFARLRYPNGAIQQRFGYDMARMDPLLHADSWAAVRTGSIDLTDPWPAARLFPV